LRRQCERDLLVQYRRHLSEHGVEELNDEELWTDYRLAAAYTTSYAVGMTLVDLVNEEGRAYAEVAVRRAEAATIDLRLDELV
jgi:hypothetical protein